MAMKTGSFIEVIITQSLKDLRENPQIKMPVVVQNVQIFPSASFCGIVLLRFMQKKYILPSLSSSGCSHVGLLFFYKEQKALFSIKSRNGLPWDRFDTSNFGGYKKIPALNFSYAWITVWTD